MQSPVKFYVLVGSAVLTLFVTGCASDTAIYSDTATHAQTGPNGAPPEEQQPPQTAVDSTSPAPTETNTPVVETPPEPKTPPPVNQTQPAPWKPAPNTTGNSAPVAASYPKATRVPGKPNRVISPHAPYAGEVDVSGFASGDQVKCPYTGKIFIVP